MQNDDICSSDSQMQAFRAAETSDMGTVLSTSEPDLLLGGLNDKCTAPACSVYGGDACGQDTCSCISPNVCPASGFLIAHAQATATASETIVSISDHPRFPDSEEPHSVPTVTVASITEGLFPSHNNSNCISAVIVVSSSESSLPLSKISPGIIGDSGVSTASSEPSVRQVIQEGKIDGIADVICNTVLDGKDISNAKPPLEAEAYAVKHSASRVVNKVTFAPLVAGYESDSSSSSLTSSLSSSSSSSSSSSLSALSSIASEKQTIKIAGERMQAIMANAEVDDDNDDACSVKSGKSVHKMEPEEYYLFEYNQEQQRLLQEANPLPPTVPSDNLVGQAGTQCGTVTGVVENVAVVLSRAGSSILDEGSVLCTADKVVIGTVAEVFGKVLQPNYVVNLISTETTGDALKEPLKCPSESGLTSTSEAVATLKPGTSVWAVSSMKKVIYDPKKYEHKGCDASWKDDVEVPDHHQDFSDDEAEMLAKKRRKQMRASGGQKGSSVSGNRSDGAHSNDGSDEDEAEEHKIALIRQSLESEECEFQFGEDEVPSHAAVSPSASGKLEVDGTGRRGRGRGRGRDRSLGRGTGSGISLRIRPSIVDPSMSAEEPPSKRFCANNAAVSFSHPSVPSIRGSIPRPPLRAAPSFRQTPMPNPTPQPSYPSSILGRFPPPPCVSHQRNPGGYDHPPYQSSPFPPPPPHPVQYISQPPLPHPFATYSTYIPNALPPVSTYTYPPGGYPPPPVPANPAYPYPPVNYSSPSYPGAPGPTSGFRPPYGYPPF